jgi:hypothetical protein
MFGGSCNTPSGCVIHFPDGAENIDFRKDYTIVDDGHTYKWTFTIDQPGATVYVPDPNEVQHFLLRKTATGFQDLSNYDPFPFRFERQRQPGSNVAVYFVSAPRGKPFTCDDPTTKVGAICFENYRVWNNSAVYSFDGISGPFSMRIQVLAVPEPATWAMMLGGLGLVGATVRRRKVALA